ncbi:histidine phosphatase family protein [Mycolicibacterium sp. 018/SC-01/001]|uniref:histidine phosphatase family protein n=1 Tax=Mycolicibacterium sp. 018/SC-01/001 TaxID=2592069 RepID=UPI00117BE536|nr:histidine phosphatase family protein [Mycolicibacterium sp. 018/SC-01/001]TRW88907.1 histidine phosphatase family protein [Mycolicibacterium sp. 018/SC-01/001]
MSGRLVLVRHGQTHSNVARRLDTRPPGAELTELGREQARGFADSLVRPPGLIAHSIATRAVQTAQLISTAIGTPQPPAEFDGLHEVQVGDLEDRADEAAHEEFNAIYRRWHDGELDVRLPGGESGHQVLDRYVPVLDDLRMRYLDDDAWGGDIVVVSHGAAIRLVAAVLAGVDSTFAIDHHLANTETVVLAPVTDGRWSCLQWGALTPPFGPDAAVTTVDASADPMG